jgi:hypothetical protein
MASAKKQMVGAPGSGHYNYAIVFRQHTDAAKEYKRRWKKLVKTINTDPNVVIADWLQRLQRGADGVGEDDDIDTPPRDTDLVLLKRAEGGIGGDDTQTCRQIRFHPLTTGPELRALPTDHNEIKLSARQSWDGADVWTPAELCVYRDTFSEVVADRLGTEAHEKRIEIDFVLF